MSPPCLCSSPTISTRLVSRLVNAILRRMHDFFVRIHSEIRASFASTSLDCGRQGVHLTRIACAKIEHAWLIAANNTGCLNASHEHCKAKAAGEVAVGDAWWLHLTGRVIRSGRGGCRFAHARRSDQATPGRCRPASHQHTHGKEHRLIRVLKPVVVVNSRGSQQFRKHVTRRWFGITPSAHRRRSHQRSLPLGVVRGMPEPQKFPAYNPIFGAIPALHAHGGPYGLYNSLSTLHVDCSPDGVLILT